MQYKILFRNTAELPYGSISLQYVCRVSHRLPSTTTCSCSDVAWSASHMEPLLKFSLLFFRKHGYKDPKSASYWVDLGNCGLAMKIKATDMKLHPDHVAQYRITSRRVAYKTIWQLLRRGRPHTKPLSLGLLSSLERETSHTEPSRQTESMGSLFTPPLDLCRDPVPQLLFRVSQKLPENSDVKLPSFPFQAARVRLQAKGKNFIASIFDRDSVASFMARTGDKNCEPVPEKSFSELPLVVRQMITDKVYKLFVDDDNCVYEVYSVKKTGDSNSDTRSPASGGLTLASLSSSKASTTKTVKKTVLLTGVPINLPPGIECKASISAADV